MLVVGIFVGLGTSGCDEETDNSNRPFRHVHRLPKGGKVVVEGTESRDWSGDHNEKYTLSLQLPGQKMETVARVETRLSEGGEPPLVPDGPFRLQSQGNLWLFTDGRSFFVRPKRGGSWLQRDLSNDRDLMFWGRAIMPGRTAHDDNFAQDDHYSWIERQLPNRPRYILERSDLKKRLIILRQSGHLDAQWPLRVVFEDWHFSPQKTVALDRKWKLRPLPHRAKIEIIALDFANIKNRPMFFRVAEAAQVRGARLLWKRNKTLSLSALEVTLQHWWKQKGPTKLQIRGICADPNPQLLHFQWRIGAGQWFWVVARQNQQLELRESESLLEAPYLYVRIRWPEPQIKAK